MKFEIHKPDEPPKKKFEIQPEKKKFVVENQNEIYMSDLYRVGPEKPIGYLPLRLLEEISDRNEEELTTYLNERGVETVSIGGPGNPTWHGPAFYAFHRPSLQALLDSHKDILIKYNWPTEADEFIKHVSSHHAQPQELFDLVADAFGDKLNPGRLDRK
jgi:hypothetical protein